MKIGYPFCVYSSTMHMSQSCALLKLCNCNSRQLQLYSTFNQGIIDMNRNGNFCKGTCFSKVIAEIKVDARVDRQKKFTGFSRMSVMANLLCFECFAAG